ncbi:MAG: hypothetical protein Q7N50_10825 [Armatimonadota bacterium]|nr:hypothetical protein [Armatimonadota bacterium]
MRKSAHPAATMPVGAVGPVTASSVVAVVLQRPGVTVCHTLTTALI